MGRESITALLDSWLSRQLKGEAAAWLREACTRIADTASSAGEKHLFIAFGSAARRVGKEDLKLSAADLATAATIVADWNPAQWSCDQAARARLVLALPSAAPEAWLATLDQLFAASGLEELVALYQALPLLPYPERLKLRAAEGVRTNMQAVFEAVALDNPYAAAWLDEGAWNQLVLKTLFVGRPLARVVGLGRRANPRLSRMLLDFARERRAAGRTISDEVWPLVSAGGDAPLQAEANGLRASVAAGSP